MRGFLSVKRLLSATRLARPNNWQMFPNSTLVQAEYWRLNFDDIYTLELWTDD